jgi:hypothetical protein
MARIPLTPEAQRFRITLKGAEYVLSFKWNNLVSETPFTNLQIPSFSLPLPPDLSKIVPAGQREGFKIPLTPEAQRFNIKLGLKEYVLSFKWNEATHIITPLPSISIKPIILQGGDSRLILISPGKPIPERIGVVPYCVRTYSVDTYEG